MQRATNILFSSIMLILMLLSISGVSIEKCSCTGRVSLTVTTDFGCCSGDDDCMTLKTMQLPEYEPTSPATVHVPVLPAIIHSIPCLNQVPAIETRPLERHVAEVPPGVLATTVAVMRV